MVRVNLRMQAIEACTQTLWAHQQFRYVGVDAEDVSPPSASLASFVPLAYHSRRFRYDGGSCSFAKWFRQRAAILTSAHLDRLVK